MQEFILRHVNEDPARIALQKSPFPGLSSADLAQQAAGRKRSEKKLPLWARSPGIYFPPRLNIEQASSELSASYKSRLLRGERAADLTGGFGVDSYYFALRASNVVHIEQNQELSEIAEHNLRTLGARNVSFVRSDSITFLERTESSFDTIYIDPDRRTREKKAFLLEDTVPDVPGNMPLLLQKTKRLIIKTSPLLDIQSGLGMLKHVSEIHVVSIKNDCKELLWVIDREFEKEPLIVCAMLANDGTRLYSFSSSREKDLHITDFSMPLTFLYEPDVALLKAGCFKSVAADFDVAKLHKNTHLYTSAVLLKEFPGRTFRITGVSEYNSLKKHPVKKANIITRNFPLSPDEIKKKHKINDGGELFLFFCTGPGDKLLVIHTERI